MSETPSSQSEQLRQPLRPQQIVPGLKPATERLTIDDMLQKYCGEFGPWQIKQFLLINLCWIVDAFHTMVIIFADRAPDWRCVAGSGCDQAATSVCGLQPGSWEWVEGPGSSTVAEWGLVCGEKYKVGLAQAMFFLGGVIGDGIFGPISDSSFGRKRSLALVCIFNTIFGFMTAFSPSFWTYAALRFLTGVSTSGNGLCAFVLATEPVGPSKRGTVGMSSFYFFSTGIAILVGIAYVFQSWRKLYIVSTIPSFILLVTVLPFVSESPRWYLVRGKVDEAMNIMASIAKSNGKHIPEGVALALDNEAEDLQLKTKSGGSSTLLDVIRSPVTRTRLFLASAISFLCAVGYYGLSLNVVNLQTNLYVTVLINAVAEIPAFIVTAALLNKLGRRGVGIWTFWFSGFFCLIGSMMISGGGWAMVKTVCGVLGMFGMAGNYNLLFILSAELFPTEVRNTAVGVATQATEIGAMVAPFVVILGEQLPLLMFAACGIIGGILVFFIPETRNKPLYDTIAGMERGERDEWVG